MGKREKQKRQQKRAEKQAVKEELARRHYKKTEPVRRILWTLATAVLVFAFGGALSYYSPQIVNAFVSNITGPFGELDKQAFNDGEYATVVTDEGEIKIDLNHEKETTTANFIKLAKDDFYQGTTFHRVIEGFMIQGGDPNTKDDDPTNDGAGGPGYTFDDELTGDEEYIRGTVAMANSGPNTNGSQFFIVQEDQPGLSSNYTTFGKVVEGMGVVDTIAQQEVAEGGNGEQSRPVDPTTIQDIVITKE